MDRLLGAAGATVWTVLLPLWCALLVALSYDGFATELPQLFYAVGLLVFALVNSVYVLVQRQWWRRHVRWLVGFAVFVAVLAMNVRLSVLPENSFLAVWHLLAIPAACVCGWVLITVGARAGLLMGLAASAAAVALLGVNDYLHSGVRTGGVFHDANVLAVWLNMAFFMCSGWLLAPPAKSSQGAPVLVASCVLLLLLALGVSVSFSRAGLLILCGGSVVLAGLFLARGLAWRRAILIPALAIAGLLSALAVPLAVELTSGDQLVEMAPGIQPSEEQSEDEPLRGLSNRSALWQAAFAIYQEAPLLGAGVQSFQVLYPGLRTSAEQATTGSYVHNDYLQLLAEGGPLLPLLLIGVVIAVLMRGVKVVRRKLSVPLESFSQEKRRLADDMIVLAAVVAMLGVAAQAMVTFVFYVLPVGLVVGLLLALVSATDADSADVELQHSVSTANRYAMVAMLLLATVLLPAYRQLGLDAAQHAVMMAHPGMNFVHSRVSSASEYEQLLLSLRDAGAQRSLPHLGLGAFYQQQARSLPFNSKRLKRVEQAATELREAMAIDPLRPQASISYARLLIDNRSLLDPDLQAQIPVILRDSIAADPTDIAAYDTLAKWLHLTGDNQALYELLVDQWLPWHRYMRKAFPAQTAVLMTQLQPLAAERDDQVALKAIGWTLRRLRRDGFTLP